MSTSVPFQKMNGLGNEIVVVDLRGRAAGASAARLCAPSAGGGLPHFDQMMVLHDARDGGNGRLRAHL